MKELVADESARIAVKLRQESPCVARKNEKMFMPSFREHGEGVKIVVSDGLAGGVEYCELPRRRGDRRGIRDGECVTRDMCIVNICHHIRRRLSPSLRPGPQLRA